MTLPDGDRRQFFQRAFGRWAEGVAREAEGRVVQRRYLRPPGALPEVGFLAACTRCGECATACPPRAIRLLPPGDGLAAGTPAIDVVREPCIGCPDMPCAAACPTEALTVPERGWHDYRLGRLRLEPARCVTFAGLECRKCVDACPVGPAALVLDGLGHPALRIEGCIGCGSCVPACPSTPSAWTLIPAEQ